MENLGYRDLLVWQKSMDLAVLVYRITTHFPKEERYGLTAQMRRSAISVPSNIAEGKYRWSTKALHQFLLIAFGSAGELETQSEIAYRVHYLSEDEYHDIINRLHEILRMLNKLICMTSQVIS